jgi:hypothetical protein
VHAGLLWGNLQEGDDLEHVGAGRRVILNCVVVSLDHHRTSGWLL